VVVLVGRCGRGWAVAGQWFTKKYYRKKKKIIIFSLLTIITNNAKKNEIPEKLRVKTDRVWPSGGDRHHAHRAFLNTRPCFVGEEQDGWCDHIECVFGPCGALECRRARYRVHDEYDPSV
jgi:hypothetical protein